MFVNKRLDGVITIRYPLLPFSNILLYQKKELRICTTVANFSSNHFTTPGSETPVMRRPNIAPSTSVFIFSFHQGGGSTGSSLTNCRNFDMVSDLTLLTSTYSSIMEVHVLSRYESKADKVVDDVVSWRRYFPWFRIVRLRRMLR